MWLFKEKEVIESKKKYIDYLPVGTVVKLYNHEEEYMIYRYMGNACMAIKNSSWALKYSKNYKVTSPNKNTYYNVDYALVPYPHAMGDEELYIMHEDIEEVLFLGYDDELRKNILNDIDTWNRVGDFYG